MKNILSRVSLLLLITTSALAGSEVSDKKASQQGDIKCVHHVIQEMDKRLRKLSKSCDHDTIFALAYLRTTEKYKETADSIGYDDVESVTREDALFADYYFRAYDAYHSSAPGVPPAWQIAFDAAQNRSVSSVGNAFLGFNAHIQRDLPFTLYELHQRGVPVSEADHFKVNDFLAQVSFGDEIVDRFDPAYPLGGSADIVFLWRSIAWDNFELLRDAENDAARALIAAAIEEYAAQQAAYFAYVTALPPGTDSSERDEYCEENHCSR